MLHQHGQVVQQQVAEIYGVEVPQPVLIRRVELDRPAAGEIACFGGGHLLRAPALVLPALDHGVQHPRRPALGIDIGGFEMLLEQAELIVRIEDREVGFQADKLGMAAQDARGERMERAEPDLLRDARAEQRRDQPGDPLAHFARRPVGERDREDLPGHGAAGGEDVDDPRGERPCLARTGAGQHQDSALGLLHRRALGLVQPVQPYRIGHRGRRDGSALGQQQGVGSRLGHRLREYRAAHGAGLSRCRFRRLYRRPNFRPGPVPQMAGRGSL